MGEFTNKILRPKLNAVGVLLILALLWGEGARRFLTQDFLSCIFFSRSVAVRCHVYGKQMVILQVLESKATTKVDTVHRVFFFLIEV